MWHGFMKDEPGERFRLYHKRLREQHSTMCRACVILIGVVLFAVGVVLCFIPGPGVPVMLFGVALMAGESKKVVTLLDRVEPRARALGRKGVWLWRRLPMAVKGAAVFFCLAAGAAVALGGWLVFFG